MPDALPDVASIATPRLVLEAQVAADADPMFELLQDPAIYRYENEPPPSLEWLRERYRRLESRRSADGRELWLNWIVRLRTGAPAGFVQATVHGEGSAGIAYVFASRYWGQGLATEAVRAMIDELVARYGIARLAAVLKRGNVPSVRLLERLGFALASRDAHREQAIADDEILMERDAPRAGPEGT